MTTTDTDQAALLRTILDSPDDDAPRRVYSDWLQEHGELDRAEFIRVQCELARIGPEWDTEPEYSHTEFIDGRHVGGGEVVVDLVRTAPSIGARVCIRIGPRITKVHGMKVFAVNEYYDQDERRNCFRVHLKRDEYSGKAWKRIKTILRRERELWDTHSAVWFHQDGLTEFLKAAYIGAAPAGHPSHAIYQRGFAGRASLPLAAWLEHGPRLVRMTPLEIVRISDREPANRANINAKWYWFIDHRALGNWDNANHLPSALFDLLTNSKINTTGLPYDSPDAAHADLSRAALQWARQTEPRTTR